MTRLRIVLVLALAAVLLATGSTAAFAIWTTTGSTASSVTIGKMSASLTGTSAMTTTFASDGAPVTNPVTMTNTGSIGGTATTTVSVVSGSSTALAQAVSVVAWPVASTDACASSTPVGSGSVSGTWASLPSMTSTLAPGAAAVWCIRSTPTASAPPSATTNIIIGLTVTAGSWTSTLVNGGFYLNTPAASTATPAVTCVDHSGNYVDLQWDTSSRPVDTWYGAFVGGAKVGASAQGYSGAIQVAPTDVPASVADGTATVSIDVLDADGNATSTVVASGPITLFQQNDARAIRCGS